MPRCSLPFSSPESFFLMLRSWSRDCSTAFLNLSTSESIDSSSKRRYSAASALRLSIRKTFPMTIPEETPDPRINMTSFSSIVFIKTPVNEFPERDDRGLGITALGPELYLRAATGGKYEHSHDAFAVYLLPVLLDEYLGVEVSGKTHEMGGGPRVKAEPVLYHELFIENVIYLHVWFLRRHDLSRPSRVRHGRLCRHIPYVYIHAHAFEPLNYTLVVVVEYDRTGNDPAVRLMMDVPYVKRGELETFFVKPHRVFEAIHYEHGPVF